MKKTLFTMVAGTVLGTLALLTLTRTHKAQQTPTGPQPSWPPDTRHYTRPAIPEDRALQPLAPLHGCLQLAGGILCDVLVATGNANLIATDTFNDGEPSIAVNPANALQIVITTFSGAWQQGPPAVNAPLWYSNTAGVSWQKLFAIQPPNMVPTPMGGGGPADQTVDYGRGGRISGAFLNADAVMPNPMPPPAVLPSVVNIYSSTTVTPATAGSWGWKLVGGAAQLTNTNATNAPMSFVDQPWLLVNPDPAIMAQDNVYVAYDDFFVAPVHARVATGFVTAPPIINNAGMVAARDVDVGAVGSAAGCHLNPGHRLAVNAKNGFVYSLFQNCNGAGAGGSNNISYAIHRSTDGGATFPLSVVVDTQDSDQPGPPADDMKFGTANALLGGVDHEAVDPSVGANGAVYVVFGERDGNGNNKLALRRLTDQGAGGGLVVGAKTYVTDPVQTANGGFVQAALPSVAVARNGKVGVLYTTFDGLAFVGNLPIYSAHLAISTDGGATFTDRRLFKFVSPAADDRMADNQRVLGDYQQLKAVGNTFYGAFTGNGQTLGRPFSNNDPIFFRVFVG